jgi:hypothetical protein
VPRYYRVSPKFWTDHAWSDDARLLALYLLTCSHRTTEGLYRLPKAYARADLGWSAEPLGKGLPERLDQALAELVASDFCTYDERAQVMLIHKALKHQSPENGNQVTAALRQLEDLPRTPLTSKFRGLAERFCQRLAERLPEGFAEPIPDPPSPSPSPSPSLASLASARPRPKRATALPDDLTLNGPLGQYAKDQGLTRSGAMREFEKFRNHHRAKGSTFKDWSAAWRTWVLRCAEQPRLAPTPNPPDTWTATKERDRLQAEHEKRDRAAFIAEMGLDDLLPNVKDA